MTSTHLSCPSISLPTPFPSSLILFISREGKSHWEVVTSSHKESLHFTSQFESSTEPEEETLYRNLAKVVLPKIRIAVAEQVNNFYCWALHYFSLLMINVSLKQQVDGNHEIIPLYWGINVLLGNIVVGYITTGEGWQNFWNLFFSFIFERLLPGKYVNIFERFLRFLKTASLSPFPSPRESAFLCC